MQCALQTQVFCCLDEALVFNSIAYLQREYFHEDRSYIGGDFSNVFALILLGYFTAEVIALKASTGGQVPQIRGLD